MELAGAIGTSQASEGWRRDSKALVLQQGP